MYTLVINLKHATREAAAELIVNCCRARFGDEAFSPRNGRRRVRVRRPRP